MGTSLSPRSIVDTPPPLHRREHTLLLGQRRVIELLARKAPLADMLAVLCETIEALLPGVMSSVLLFDARAGTLHHGAAPQLPKPYCDAIDGVHVGPRVGSCGTAAFLRKAVTVEDIATDPLWADFKGLALSHGLAACTSTPILSATNDVLGTFALYHRIPGAYDADELALLRDVSALATLVIESDRRDAALRSSEEVIRQTQRLDSLGILAGGIAHDFNNILAAMLGNLNLAEGCLAEGSPALPYLKTLETSVLRAAALTKQILAYSGKGRFVIQQVDLSVVVHEVASLLAAALPKTVSLCFDLVPAGARVDADVAQLQQVVMNLVTNAAEAMVDREGMVSLATRLTDVNASSFVGRTFIGQPLARGRYVVLEVGDTGCGMSTELVEKIFEPFFTTKPSGSGLGLAATLGILRGHRAGLTIATEPGRGTTFQLYFPASSREIEISAPPLDMPVPAARTSASGGLALVVDDEEPLRRITARFLMKLGFEILEASNGLEAVELVEKHRSGIALVIMDMTMPRMGGGDAFRAMRRIQPTLPVILCSGYNEHEAIQGLRGSGLSGFLQKPYQAKDFKAAVAAALAGRPGK